MSLITYADCDMLFIQLANQIAGDLNAALERGTRVLFAVPGGTTPGPVFDNLCAADLDWSRVDVTLTDERWVPEQHIRSNAKLIRERLLVNKAASANFIPLYVRATQPEDVLDERIAALTPLLPIAVLLLGMGVDMHTASLFPASEGLATALRSDAPVLVPVRPNSQQDVRVSMSARVLNDAVVKHVLITGTAKKAAYEHARVLGPEQAPISAVLRDADVHWAA